jgi:hypothetical protein
MGLTPGVATPCAQSARLAIKLRPPAQIFRGARFAATYAFCIAILLYATI